MRADDLTDFTALPVENDRFWAVNWGNAYMVRCTEAEASKMRTVPAGKNWSIARALKSQGSGEPVEVTPWRPELPIDYLRVVAEHASGEAALLQRTDGQLAAVHARYFDEILDHFETMPEYGPDSTTPTTEQLGGVQAMIRFRCGDQVIAYLMPLWNGASKKEAAA